MGEVLEDRHAAVGDDKRGAFKFRLVWHREMGMPRKSGGKNPGFIDTVLNHIGAYYGEVVQNISPWVPPAPKIKHPPPLTTDADEADDAGATSGIDPPQTWRPSTVVDP